MSERLLTDTNVAMFAAIWKESRPMLKRDVEMIARVVRKTPGNRWKLAVAFAQELAQITPAFDRVKFIKACGVRMSKLNPKASNNATPI